MHAHPLLSLHYLCRDISQLQPRPRRWAPWRTGQWDLPSAQAAGLKLQIFVVYVPAWPLRRCWDAGAETRQQLAAFDRLLANASAHIEHVATAAEVGETARRGKLAAMLAVEGAHVLGGDPAQVEYLRQRGIRYMTLVHFIDNGLVRSTEQPWHCQAPLTRLGREVVQAMERSQMIIDLAHCTRASFDAVCAATAATVISTHSGVEALAPLERNLDLAQLQEIARREGLVGVIAFPWYLKRKLRCHVGDLADVVCYLCEQIGVQRVAIGMDFDSFIWTPRGLDGVEDLPWLTAELLRRGLSESDLAALLGENALRLLARHDRADLVGMTNRQPS
jgi:membrane dipeptidase